MAGGRTRGPVKLISLSTEVRRTCLGVGRGVYLCRVDFGGGEVGWGVAANGSGRSLLLRRGGGGDLQCQQNPVLGVMG